MSDETTSGLMCFKCDEKQAGPGGILCPDCFTAISAVRLPSP